MIQFIILQCLNIYLLIWEADAEETRQTVLVTAQQQRRRQRHEEEEEETHGVWAQGEEPEESGARKAGKAAAEKETGARAREDLKRVWLRGRRRKGKAKQAREESQEEAGERSGGDSVKGARPESREPGEEG